MQKMAAIILAAAFLCQGMGGFAGAVPLVFPERGTAASADGQVGAASGDATSSNAFSSNANPDGSPTVTARTATPSSASNASLASFSSQNGTIYKVSFPASTAAYLNPENIGEFGQVFSDEFEVKNYGNTDVAIKIKNIGMDSRSARYFPASAGDAALDDHGESVLDVDIVWENQGMSLRKTLRVADGDTDEYVLFLKAAEYDEGGNFLRLSKGSVGCFYFTGTVKAGEVLNLEEPLPVSFYYDICNGDEVEILEDGTIQKTETEEELTVSDPDEIVLEYDLEE